MTKKSIDNTRDGLRMRCQQLQENLSVERSANNLLTTELMGLQEKHKAECEKLEKEIAALKSLAQSGAEVRKLEAEKNQKEIDNLKARLRRAYAALGDLIEQVQAAGSIHPF